MGSVVCLSMNDVPDAAIYCAKHVRTMEIFTFFYMPPYYIYFHQTTAKKLEKSAFRAILVRLLSSSQEIAKNTQTNHQEKARISPDNELNDWSPHFNVKYINLKSYISALHLSNESENWLAVFRARTLCCLKMPEDAQARTNKRWKDLMAALAADVINWGAQLSPKKSTLKFLIGPHRTGHNREHFHS